MPENPAISIEEFSAEVEAWLETVATRRVSHKSGLEWGQGEFDVSVFANMTFEQERDHIAKICEWIEQKAEHGYHAVDWPIEYGGLGLSRAYARAAGRVERGFQTPGSHELVGVTAGLIAPTIRLLGSDWLKERFVDPFRRTEELVCQLFSEPGAGSDLAGLATKAERDGDEWVINGQKVWSSGAQFSQWGQLIARTDPDVIKHKGMTAFMLPLDAPGVEVRSIKQMSGGSSFCEVFFNDVRVHDDLRLGEVGGGWKVANTTLSFERDHSDSGSDVSASGGSWKHVLATARHMGVTNDPVVRDEMMKAYIHGRVETYTARRAADLAKSGTPGPEGSLGKLMWTEGMTRIGDLIGTILGPRLAADTGEWGTYGWNDHLLGAPGYRIAGGSDEVQRNIIGERVLGLGKEPRADAGPWRDIPR